MPSSLDLRRRIKSVRNTAQITKAMQMVSAAKMRRAQDSALGGKSYSLLMGDILVHLSPRIHPDLHPLLNQRPIGRVGVLLLTTNRGLVGSLNTNVLREATQITTTATFITVGRKGRDFSVKTNRELIADFELPEKVDFGLARTLGKMIKDSYLKGEIDQALLVYSDFVNTLKQEPKTRGLLPIKPAELTDQTEVSAPGEYLFEPKAEELLEALLPHYLDMKIYQALLEAAASEHSARMVAMKNATDNAQDLVEDLKLTYNQLRQNKITNEILEITTAAVAME
jgi:F-type H+-transporting ATPase subunit gamma